MVTDVSCTPVQAMLDEVQAGHLTYTFDDYKTLLQLQLQIDQSGKDATGGMTDSIVGAPLANEKNRRAYGEFMIVSLSLSPGSPWQSPELTCSNACWGRSMQELFSLDNGNEGDD